MVPNSYGTLPVIGTLPPFLCRTQPECSHVLGCGLRWSFSGVGGDQAIFTGPACPFDLGVYRRNCPAVAAGPL